MTDAELRDLLGHDYDGKDHILGCQRLYCSCTCGYDRKRDDAITTLAAELIEARAERDALREALELLVRDVADYEAWQRPCLALDNAREALAMVQQP